MKKRRYFFSSLLVALLILCFSCTDIKHNELSKKPTAENQPKELVTHGDTRVDNYYWMRLTDEQKNAKDPDDHTRQVLDYLKQENEYLKGQMAHTEAFQDALYKELTGRIKQNDESAPYLSNGYWYYTRFEEGMEFPVYCRKRGNINAPEEVMLNANEMAKGKDYFNVAGLSISPDNKFLAFGTDTKSRRRYTLQIKNLETGALLPDKITNTEPGYAWADDNMTLFYTAKNPETLLSEKIYRHSLGSNQNADVMVYHEKDESFYIGVYRSKSGKYIIIWNSSTEVSDYHILKSDNPDGIFKGFTPRQNDLLYDIAHLKDKFYIRTNLKAKNFRLMETSETATSIENWSEKIAHREDVLMERVELFKDHMAIEERKDGLVTMRIIQLSTGDEHHVAFDEPAYAAGMAVNREMNTEKLRFTYSSLTTPQSTFDYDMVNRTSELIKEEEVVGGHNKEDYTTERRWATARDGKKIPLSIVYKKGFTKAGNSPVLLYGYGSYGHTIDASFRSDILSLLDRGFAFAIAHIRGGQMLGRSWYEDGKLLKKKNTFNDFIDCGKYLVEQKYTNPNHLYAWGGSAGGLLMGAILNMEPQLWSGVVAAVPFVDVVTTMSDPTIPLTTNEYDEWGNPENKEYYQYMLSYSPYDNVKKQVYPNILITTGLFDSQVQYWEPAKWVAKLRDMNQKTNKLLFQTNMEAGHGGASGRFRRYKERALVYAFMLDLEGISR